MAPDEPPRTARMKTAVNLAASGAQNCSLLSLPAELKMYIWELALSVDIPDDERGLRITRKADGCPSVLDLLATCRQIYEEASAIFYNRHRLDFRTDLKDILQVVKDPRRVAKFRSLIVHTSHEEGISATFKAAAHLPRLNEICLVFDFAVDPARPSTYIPAELLIEDSKREPYHIKRAAKRLSSVKKVVLETPYVTPAIYWKHNLPSAICEEALVRMKEFEKKINALLPSNLKKYGDGEELPDGQIPVTMMTDGLKMIDFVLVDSQDMSLDHYV